MARAGVSVVFGFLGLGPAIWESRFLLTLCLRLLGDEEDKLSLMGAPFTALVALLCVGGVIREAPLDAPLLAACICDPVSAPVLRVV